MNSGIAGGSAEACTELPVVSLLFLQSCGPSCKRTLLPVEPRVSSSTGLRIDERRAIPPTAA